MLTASFGCAVAWLGCSLICWGCRGGQPQGLQGHPLLWPSSRDVTRKHIQLLFFLCGSFCRSMFLMRLRHACGGASGTFWQRVTLSLRARVEGSAVEVVPSGAESWYPRRLENASSAQTAPGIMKASRKCHFDLTTPLLPGTEVPRALSQSQFQS